MKCIRNLSIQQLIKLSQRYDLKPKYKNPRKRVSALRRCLRDYWRINPIGECSICWEQIRPNELFVTPCAHLFCNKCLLPHIRQCEKCPICRSDCSYTHLLKKMILFPELLAFLKSLIAVPHVEEEEQPVEEQQQQLVEEEEPHIYNVSVYIIIERGIDTVHVFLTAFVAYYFYLFIIKGIKTIWLCMNIATIFYIVYYMLSLHSHSGIYQRQAT